MLYNQSAKVNYQVCLKKNSYYKESCQKEDIEYISILTDKIRGEFSYTEVYQEPVEKKFKYYISSEIVTETDQEESKELLKNEKKITDVKEYKGKSNVININDTAEISFKEYNEYIQQYINEYSLIGNSNLILSLVIKTDKEEKKVSNLTIPLNDLTYHITKNEISEQQVEDRQPSDSIIKKVFIFGIIISTIILFILIIKLSMFIYKTTNKKTNYQKEVKKILNTYDRVIINLTKQNTIINENEVYIVETFLELLDVRDTIDKPILYYKVNNIKTEFYVQDTNKTYKFTLKETDFRK